MKSYFSILFVSFILCCRISFAQIELEHSYHNASTLDTSGDQLMMVNFENEGYQYIKINRSEKKIEIYDLAHELVKTIIPPDSLMTPVGVAVSLYFSEELFDEDAGIEFMVQHDPSGTYILDEDGSQLFFKPNQFPQVFPTSHNQQYPIYNTTSGTKMILSSLVNDSAYVYSLPGTFSTFIQEQNNSLLQQMNSSSVYPNPSNQVSTIEYEIAPSDLPATLKIYDATGKQIASANISSVKGKIEIPLSGFSSGTYEYQIQSGVKILSTGKFIVSQ